MGCVSVQKIALAAEDISDTAHSGRHHGRSRDAVARGHAAKIEGFFHMFGIADVTRDARRLLRAKRQQMPYLPLVESEQRPCRSSRAEGAAHAVRAAQGSGQ